MDDRLDEILHRLRDLDRRLERLEREHGRDDDRGPRDHGCRDHEDRGRSRGYGRRGRDEEFDERRVIDTIVRLTCENLEPILAEVVARELDKRAPRDNDDK